MNAYSGETLMQFPVAIEWGDENTATGIIFPDIPGAITAADTLEQAYAQAVEVVHLQLTELAKAGQQIPRPGKVAELRKRPEYDGYGWGFVEVDVTPYLGRTEKINVTLPGIVIRKIDAYVALHGIKSRSAFLASVATEKLEGL
jgi:predicted RNase H-like HicB family nuclease